MASGSGSVTNAGSSVNINDVCEALSSADEAILLRVSLLGDGAGNSVIDCGGDRFVICVFETERSGVLGCSLDGAECWICLRNTRGAAGGMSRRQCSEDKL